MVPDGPVPLQTALVLGKEIVKKYEEKSTSDHKRFSLTGNWGSKLRMLASSPSFSVEPYNH
jgi:hypothetical protein